MMIYSMTATFGKLEHETLTLEPGLNIIEAPNEWGKSTWCAFLVAMLYGISTREHTTKTVLADKKRYAPWSGSPMSGRMDLCWNGRDITIERRSAGRSILGEFQAFETQSGLPVTELNADNCGQMLLGVEKSVFTRSAFLRLTDLPVSADDALRRRLNALVTTGDESGAGDTLAQKLKKLKNTCRSNAANGLIPQTQAQKAELEEKLRQIERWNTRLQQLQSRDKELALQLDRLYNHRDALEYAQAREHNLRCRALRLQLEHADAMVLQRTKECSHLADTDTLRLQLEQRQTLKEQRESLQTQLQLLIPPPQTALSPGRRAVSAEQAAQDARRYEQLLGSRKKPSPALWILGLCVLAAGGAVSLWQTLVGIGLMAVGAALLVAGLLTQNAAKLKNTALEHEAQLLRERYHPLEPTQWEAAARDHRDALTRYTLAVQQYNNRRSQLQGQLQDVSQKLSAMESEQQLRDALASRQALKDAQREYDRLDETIRVLGADKEVTPPAHLDTLTDPPDQTQQKITNLELERQQLRHDMGQCRGQIQALGDTAALQAQLAGVNARLQQLEDTYCALELAQNTLAEATARLQRRFAPQISKRALSLFSRLTGGRYDRLTLDDHLRLQAGAQGEDTLQDLLWRSDGTVDQLYLALRLAVAQALTPDSPLILDDALVRFDDTRLLAALQILHEEAQSKQVILFTCQGREKQYYQTYNT